MATTFKSILSSAIRISIGGAIFVGAAIRIFFEIFLNVIENTYMYIDGVVVSVCILSVILGVALFKSGLHEINNAEQ